MGVVIHRVNANHASRSAPPAIKIIPRSAAIGKISVDVVDFALPAHKVEAMRNAIVVTIPIVEASTSRLGIMISMAEGGGYK